MPPSQLPPHEGGAKVKNKKSKTSGKPKRKSKKTSPSNGDMDTVATQKFIPANGITKPGMNILTYYCHNRDNHNQNT